MAMERSKKLGIVLSGLALFAVFFLGCQFDTSTRVNSGDQEGDQDGGVPNLCETEVCQVCPDVQDEVPEDCALCAGFTDSDSDGSLDLCDICPGFDDELDLDDDGTPDGCDLCPGSDDRVDTDANGVPDACDCGIGLTLSLEPIAFWRMDNDIDRSGNGNSLVAGLSTSFGIAQDQNVASRFIQEDDVASIANFPMPTDRLTISMWVRLRPGSSNEQYFLSYFTAGEESTDGDQINIGFINNSVSSRSRIISSKIPVS